VAQESRLLKIIRAAEDVLLFFDDYFQSTSWVYYGSGLSREQIRKSKSYLVDKELLSEDFDLHDSSENVLSLVTRPWDKKWRLVTFDIPEKHRKTRDKLGYELGKLGFRHFQRSVWISPLPINKQLERLVNRIGNKKLLSFFIGQLYKQDSKKLVGELWEINFWHEKAQKLLAKLNEEEKIDNREKNKFWDLVLDHPKVPLDLLPQDWPLSKLINAFKIKIKH